MSDRTDYYSRLVDANTELAHALALTIDQRNRAVQALVALLDETREHWGEASKQADGLCAENWAQACSMTDRPTPAEVVAAETWWDHWLADRILAALADEGYVVVDKFGHAEDRDEIPRLRSGLAKSRYARLQAIDQRNRAVRALAATMRGFGKDADFECADDLLNEDWVEATLDDDWKPWQDIGDPE